jgi:hypothetical protein
MSEKFVGLALGVTRGREPLEVLAYLRPAVSRVLWEIDCLLRSSSTL